jgi:hypothetical protein
MPQLERVDEAGQPAQRMLGEFPRLLIPGSAVPRGVTSKPEWWAERGARVLPPAGSEHRRSYTRNTFMTSSPRWLITFTAIRPDFGFTNGREVSLFRLAQASRSISALSVVFNAL